MEHEQQSNHISNDYYNSDNEEAVSGNKCGCFHLFSYFNYHHHDGETAVFIHHRLGERDIGDKNSWLMNRFKRFREFSEVIAGPKWKNFIRKFSKKPRKGNSSPFQYDPESYALNFNDSVGDESDYDCSLPRSFSTRFAPHSGSMAS
ncbi:unnamed protein product [Lactuca saligna]|uniref:Uncharacterized protein n=1 Tax=Lactuca saligna TaxID=75948 RepID=A0AA35ZKC0_LACSI|nr:unnamed protein product [Lactuca saligna]